MEGYPAAGSKSMATARHVWTLALAIVLIGGATAVYVRRYQRGTFEIIRETEQTMAESERVAVLTAKEWDKSITPAEKTELDRLRQRAKARKAASEGRAR
jgi:hypothetical protein